MNLSNIHTTMSGGPVHGRQPTIDGRPRPRFLRFVVITALSLIFAVGLLALIGWLVIKPAPLEYTVEDASIRGFNLTSDGRLNATFHLRLTADNRNKKVSVYYDSMDVTTWYDGQQVAGTEVAPFYQPTSNATRIVGDAVARGVQLPPASAEDLRKDRSSGKVELEVEVVARIRFKVAGMKSRHHVLKAHCSPVLVYFSSNQFERSYCEVDI